MATHCFPDHAGETARRRPLTVDTFRCKIPCMGSRRNAVLSSRVSSRRGERAEERVRAQLDELRGRGFVVVRGVERHSDGAIDHLVCGPTGLFLINTTRRRYGNEHLREAWRRAEELFNELHTWVTPVICPVAYRSRPAREERVWIVRGDQVADWISRQRNPVLESERVARLAERLQAPAAAETAAVS
jgi:Nuclease-related domain